MGNAFGLGKFVFPMDYASPLDLLVRVKRQLDTVKVTPTPYIERALQGQVLPLLMGTDCGRKVGRALLLDTFGKFTYGRHVSPASLPWQLSEQAAHPPPPPPSASAPLSSSFRRCASVEAALLFL